eukprot:evm.model.NODE_23629_length_13644_cov_24.987907.2
MPGPLGNTLRRDTLTFPHSHKLSLERPHTSKIGDSCLNQHQVYPDGSAMGAKRAHGKLCKTPVRIAIGTTVICAGLALLHHFWLPPSFKEGTLSASGTIVAETNDGSPSQGASPRSWYVPRIFSFSSSSNVTQKETAGSLDSLGGGAVDKELPLASLVGQNSQRSEEKMTEDGEHKETDEADKEKDGSQEAKVDEEQQYREAESIGVMEEDYDEDPEGDDDDEDSLSEEEWEEEEEEEEEKGEIEEEGKKKEEVILSLAECQTSYGNRRFLSQDEKALPPILYSFPGR